jgi:hypothetical protein
MGLMAKGVFCPDFQCYGGHSPSPKNGYGEQARRSRFLAKASGGGGSRTPVRKALRLEAYMLSSIPFVSPATLRMSKKRDRLVRLVLAVSPRTET